MKILIVDPSGTNNYCNGLAQGLSLHNQVTVIARTGFNKSLGQYEVKEYYHLWYTGRTGRFVKGINYIIGWIKTIKHAKNCRYDVIHVQWVLKYSIDIFFLKILKRYCDKLVYTAHNVIPHVDGEKKKDQLSKIYSIVSTIIVHGQSSKNELMTNFPEINESKIVIQYHGVDIRDLGGIDFSNVPIDIKNRVKKCKGKIVLFLGVIFENKGVDRVINTWINNMDKLENSLLIIAGYVSEMSDRMKECIEKANEIDTILYLPGRVDQNVHDFLYDIASIVVLPYRHASMSGVVFDAALFSKPILTTNVGCIPEYLESGNDSYIVDNDDKEFENKLMTIVELSEDELKRTGKALHDNIYRKYNWSKISNKLVHDAYN